MDIEGRHLLAKTLPDPLASAPVFSEDTEGPRSSHKMFLKWHKPPFLGPNISNHYLIEFAQYPGENWQSLGGIKKAPYNQIELKDFYSMDPHLEHQFRVKVINPHGISAASKCLITKGQHKTTENKEMWNKKAREQGKDYICYYDPETKSWEPKLVEFGIKLDWMD